MRISESKLRSMIRQVIIESYKMDDEDISLKDPGKTKSINVSPEKMKRLKDRSYLLKLQKDEGKKQLKSVEEALKLCNDVISGRASKKEFEEFSEWYVKNSDVFQLNPRGINRDKDYFEMLGQAYEAKMKPMYEQIFVKLQNDLSTVMDELKQKEEIGGYRYTELD